MSREVMQMALEALEQIDGAMPFPVGRSAITALRAALAEPEQEPVAIKWELNGDDCGYTNWLGITPFGRILITWKGWKQYHDATVDEFPGGFEAYGSPDEVKAACEAEYAKRLGCAHPPQRKPLTDEEIWLEYQRFWPFHPAEEPTLAKDIAKFARAIERASGIKQEEA